jgi:hypothetical protein
VAANRILDDLIIKCIGGTEPGRWKFSAGWRPAGKSKLPDQGNLAQTRTRFRSGVGSGGRSTMLKAFTTGDSHHIFLLESV